MKTNTLRVLPHSVLYYSLCTIITGTPQFRNMGGVKSTGNICNYVIVTRHGNP